MADTVSVVWKSYHKPEVIDRGYWDNGLLEDTFRALTEVNFNHVYDFEQVPQDEGAIVIINGRTHINDADQITQDIKPLKWVLFIDTGDEEASFPWRDVKHPLMRFWVMLPRMNEHNDAHFKLPNGYRPDTRDVIQKVGYQEKKYDWFFAGQVNHERREQCVAELNYLTNSGENGNGNLIITDGFGDQKLGYQKYMRVMSETKIVLCPSGVESPDNFRLYEALEAGCLPVVDAFSTKHKSPGFWQYLFGNDMPFPIIDYWDALPRLLPQLLKDYPANANRAFAWWQQYKRKLRYQLYDDIKELSK